MRKALLDTNAYTKLLTGEVEVLDIISVVETLYMSIFVLGELHAGFRGGSRAKENLDVLQNFLMKPSVKILNATTETAQIFGVIKSDLGKAGTPLPINDVWIAAHAVETGSIIISYDRHFNFIPGIRLWDKLKL